VGKVGGVKNLFTPTSLWAFFLTRKSVCTPYFTHHFKIERNAVHRFNKSFILEILFAFILFSNVEVYQAKAEEIEVVVIEETNEQRILREFDSDLDMFDIVRCESGFKQFDRVGGILTSPTNDVGIMQINLKTWADEALNMGIDIYTLNGNIEMGKHILKVQSKTAWVCYKK